MYDRGYPAESRQAQRLTSLVPFSVLVLAGLAVQVGVAVMQYGAISDDRDYTGSLRHVDPASIDIAHLQHLDHRVTSLSHVFLGAYAVTGILVMIWSYVARRNTDRRSDYGPARSSGWAVWGWI